MKSRNTEVFGQSIWGVGVMKGIQISHLMVLNKGNKHTTSLSCSVQSGLKFTLLKEEL